jgi:hypothetical protein
MLWSESPEGHVLVPLMTHDGQLRAVGTRPMSYMRGHFPSMCGRLCVTEYLEASLGGTTSCPECSRPLTVDLSKREGQQEEEDASKGRAQSRLRRQNGNGKHSNAAGTVCVAGKLKVGESF